MSNNRDLFDHREPRPIENARPAGGHVPAGTYERGALSKQSIKSDNHGGDLRQSVKQAGV